MARHVHCVSLAITSWLHQLHRKAAAHHRRDKAAAAKGSSGGVAATAATGGSLAESRLRTAPEERAMAAAFKPLPAPPSAMPANAKGRKTTRPSWTRSRSPPATLSRSHRNEEGGAQAKYEGKVMPHASKASRLAGEQDGRDFQVHAMTRLQTLLATGATSKASSLVWGTSAGQA